MDLSDAMTAFASTAAGGTVVIFIAKAAIEKYLRGVDETARMVKEVDKSLAVLTAQMETRFTSIERDINNLGSIVREIRK